MDSESFKALLVRVRAGDQAAAATLLRQYEPVLERIVRLRLVDPRVRRAHAVSDIMQSVMGSFFVRAALGQYELEQPEDLLRLLSVMARNKAADKARRAPGDRMDDAPVEEVAERFAAPSPSPSRELEVKRLAERARARLSPALQQLVALRAEGYEWAEIAERLGGTPEALRKQLARAVDEIAADLGIDAL